MHQDRSRRRDRQRPEFDQRNCATTEEQDARIDLAVLTLVLDRHPTQLTAAELTREMVDDLDSFGETDAVERAVRDLAGAGLLHRHGGFAIPTRAAVRFEELIRYWGCS